MNFSQLLLEFLKKHGAVTLPAFGTFYLNATNASLDEDRKNILPPGTEIGFQPAQNENTGEFAAFYASKKNIDLIAAEGEINKQINYWNTALEKNQELKIENLGAFYLEDSKLIFTGLRLENLSPAFFGLEEINISDIKKGLRNGSKPYSFIRTLFWLIPLILLISGLTYVGLEKPEIIFGEKSVLVEAPKIAPVILKKDSLTLDSLTISPKDSLVKDTIKPIVAPLKAAKKWTTKKYKKTQWKKSKKRQNP